MNDLKFTPIPDFLEPLTKREYFAGLAMQGYVTSRLVQDDHDRRKIAKWSVAMADALIEELNKPTI